MIIMGGMFAGSIITSDTICDKLYNQFRDINIIQ